MSRSRDLLAGTMLENQHMTGELQMQSEAMERLIRENTALTADKAALQMQVRGGARRLRPAALPGGSATQRVPTGGG